MENDRTPHPLESASLAYENPAFLNSPDGRLIRIMAEYAEPLARFRRERIHDTVVFFGSARFRALDEANRELELLARPIFNEPAPQHEQPARGTELDDCSANELKCRRAQAAVEMARYYEDARKLAFMLTEWSMAFKGRQRRFVVTSGGGPGIMEAANRGAYEAGGHTIGLNIELPFEQAPNPLHHARAQLRVPLLLHAQVLVRISCQGAGRLPGGFGTLDEAFEILTLEQTEKLAKKITVILYGSQYWKSVINFDVLVAKGTIAPKDLELFHFADTPEEAFALLQQGLTTNHLEPEGRRATQNEPPKTQDGGGEWTPDIAKTR